MMYMSISGIQPSQFYLSIDKISCINQWFNPENLANFNPIPIKKLNGKVIFVDGHTRAFVAYKAGLKQIPVIWEEEEWDWDMYNLCVLACEKRNITSIADLEKRILDAGSYSEKWNTWCNTVHEVLALQRL